LVGGTGFAPARARAHEFLRLACIHSTTHRENWCGRRDSHPHAPSGAAVFETARSTFHARPQMVAAAGVAPARTLWGQQGLSPPCLLIPTTPRLNWCGQRELHPHGLAPAGSSGRRVSYSATSAKWIRHGDLRSALPHTKRTRRCLRFAGKVGRGGRTCTSGVHRTARLQRAAIAALPRLENWGLGRDLHPHRHGV
jgi:hypothetical protein